MPLQSVVWGVWLYAAYTTSWKSIYGPRASLRRRLRSRLSVRSDNSVGTDVHGTHTPQRAGLKCHDICHMRIEPCALFMELNSRSRARAVNRTSLGREVKFSVNTEAAPCGACNEVTNGGEHFPPHVVKFYKFFKPSVWDLAPSDGKKVHRRQCSD